MASEHPVNYSNQKAESRQSKLTTAKRHASLKRTRGTGRHEGAHIDAPLPNLVLLDLNLPKMDGREVLALIKKDQSLKIIPTIILTTSDAESDVLISYQLQANCYLRKPAHWDAFDNLVRSINAFWLTRAKLPQQKQDA